MKSLLMAGVICALFAFAASAAIDGPLFTSSIHYPVQNEPAGICIADFNGDGIADMACASDEIDSISVLIGIEGGGYETHVDYNLGSSTNNIEAADIDGDSDIDLVVNTWSEVYTLDNTGDGTFEAPVLISGLGNTPYDFKLARVGTDAHYDLIVAHSDFLYDNLSVWENNGTGTFTLADEIQVGTYQYYLCVGDFNGNGRPDVAVSFSSAEFKVLLNDGTGTLTVDDTYTLPSRAYGLCADTFDAGAVVDLAAATNNSIEVYTNDGTGSLSLLGSVPITSDGYGLTSADFDGQNGSDLVLAGDLVEVYYNNGSGGFPSSNKYFVGDETVSLAVGDMDVDGYPDLAVPASPYDYEYWPGFVAVLLNHNGDGDFSYPTQSHTGDYTQSLCQADFDDDGNIDIATLDWWEDSVLVFLNDGAGNLTLSQKQKVGGAPYEVIAAELDGANTEDLIIGHSHNDSNFISVLLSNGDGTFGAPTKLTTGSNRPRGVFAADLDGINGLDIATTNGYYTDPTISVFLNAGGGTFGSATSYASVSASYHSAIDGGDLDGDGSIDLVVPNYTDGCVQVYYNDGSGGYATGGNIALGEIEDPYQVCVEDLNGDGDDDIIVGSDDTTEFAVIMNNGSGFDAAAYYYAGYEHVEIDVADFDADGFKDIVVLNSDSYSFSVFLGDGAGNFGAPTHYGIVSTDSEGMTIADFDDDGYPDIGVANYNSDDVSVMFNRYAILTDVEEPGIVQHMPGEFRLSQNYPNPFNPSTTIQYTLPSKAKVTVAVYNLLGQQVKVFEEGLKSAGTHQVVWNGRTTGGQAVSTGVYFYQIKAGNLAESKKMVLLK